MPNTLPVPPLGSLDFSSEFLPEEVDYSEAFDFGVDFSFLPEVDFLATSTPSDDDFGYDNVSCDVSFVSYVSLSSDPKHRRQKKRKKRSKNRTNYRASVRTSCWYINYLAPGHVRELTHELSTSDRYGEFRHWFRMPLCKVEELTTLLMTRGYVREPRTFWRAQEFRERTELLVMSSLYVLGHGASFCLLRPLCHISASECRSFFEIFLNAMMDMRDEFISMPKNATELLPIARNYENVGLPGCCGSMDVVHVRWSQCPAGDMNRAKGKETYPSLAFECVTDFNRRIMGVYGPQFGSRNDKEIVKSDPAVLEVTAGWLSKTFWRYYSACGRIRSSVGMYLICDNGYLRWPTSIFPYTHVDIASTEGYFSSNLESVRKDVECTFGILKKKMAHFTLWTALSRHQKV